MTLKRTLSQLLILTTAFTFAFSVNYLYAAVWQGPPAGTPPANNVDSPINVGTTNQVKDANLSVGHSGNTASDFGLISYGKIRTTIGGVEFPDGTVQTTAATGGQGLSFSKYLHIQDRKPSGTHGGTMAFGSYITRALNTTVTNTISGASLAANTITLPAGSYYIQARVPASSVREHRAKLRNTTAGTDTILGTNAHGDYGSGDSQVPSEIIGVFTIAAVTNFQIVHRGTSSDTNNVHLGKATNFGDVEIYTDVEIWKLD